jgi:hypothetical protein
MKKGLHFTDRNNSPYDFDNPEYNNTPEALVEDDPVPYPEIPEELPAVETTADYEGVTPAVVVPGSDGQMDAIAAARNANITIGEDMLKEGPVLVEPDEESETGHDDEPEVIHPSEPQFNAIPVEEELWHESAEDKILHEGADSTVGGLLHEGAGETELGEGEPIAEGANSGNEQSSYEGVRRSKRIKKIHKPHVG